MSEYLTLSEFVNVTKLTEFDLLTMLENGELAVSTGPLGELLIDITELDSEKLARRSKKRSASHETVDLALIEEMIASEVTNNLEEMVDEGVALALKWVEGEKT